MILLQSKNKIYFISHNLFVLDVVHNIRMIKLHVNYCHQHSLTSMFIVASLLYYKMCQFLSKTTFMPHSDSGFCLISIHPSSTAPMGVFFPVKRPEQLSWDTSRKHLFTQRSWAFYKLHNSSPHLKVWALLHATRQEKTTGLRNYLQLWKVEQGG